MTPASAAPSQFVIRPSRRTRTTDTLRLQLLMEERQRLEMAVRITELRERSPFTQPKIAEKLGIGLRAYQKLESKGTTQFDRCVELAQIHAAWTAGSPDWAHVTAEWIWDGRRANDAPDLMSALVAPEEPPAWAQRLQASVDALIALAVGEITPDVLRDELEAELEARVQAELLARRPDGADAPSGRGQGRPRRAH